MSHYIGLLRFTQQGTEHIKDSTKRAHHFNAFAKNAGVKVVAQYWTIGAYDGVLIIRAETEKKALRLLTMLAAASNVRTKRCRLSPTMSSRRSWADKAGEFARRPESMSPTEFQSLDVRKFLARGIAPLPEIRKRIAALAPGEGMAVIAPLLPSPLIELLGAQNFAHRVEHDPAGTWTTYFWREQERG